MNHNNHYDSEKYPIDSAEKRASIANGNQHHAGKDNNYAVEIAPAGQSRHVQDAVFGDMDEGGPNYRAVSKKSQEQVAPPSPMTKRTALTASRSVPLVLSLS